MTDATKEAFERCLASATIVPMQRTIGAGYAVMNEMMVVLSVEAWEALVVALDTEALTNDGP